MDYSKVKFVTPSVDGKYFTKGKVYAFEFKEIKGGYVTYDGGEKISIFIPESAHLGFKPWIPCHEDGTPLTKELTELEAEMLAMLETCLNAMSELMNHQEGWEEDYQKLQDLIKKANYGRAKICGSVLSGRAPIPNER